jgi:ribosome-binding factor A
MAKPARSSGSNQRQLRIGELVRHALAEMLARGDIHDEVLSKHVVTVPEVRIAPDLKLATCFIMPLGGGDVKPVLKALNDHKRYIRGEIAHRVNLKYAPDIRFLADESFAEAERVDALLYSDKVRRDILKQPLRLPQDGEVPDSDAPGPASRKAESSDE